MSRPLILLNALLLGASALTAIYVVRTVIAPAPRPATVAARPSTPAANAAAPAPAEPAEPTTASYAVVASRNLFSPTRSEMSGPGMPAQPAMQLPKPSLFGVVVRESGSIAYLEDPNTKRIAAYRVGDAIAGGTVQAIQADQVVLARTDGQVAVKLHDPTRPRPAQPASGQPGAGQPGAPGTPGFAQPQLGMPAGGVPGMPQPMPGQPQPQVGFGAPNPMQVIPGRDLAEQPGIPQRRPVPPNLLRRLPPGATTNAPYQ
jgi:hypothetical protein